MATDSIIHTLWRSPDKIKFAIITASLIFAIIMSVFSLRAGFVIIFQNLFYIPIIIACFFYTRRGFLFSVLVSLLYFILVLQFSQETWVLLGAVTRIIIFLVVAGLTVYISTKWKSLLDAAEKEVEDTIEWKTKFQDTISTIASRFTGIYNIDDAINATLADIARLSSADHASFYQLNDHGAVLHKTHEWYPKGKIPTVESPPVLPVEDIPIMMEKIHGRKCVHLPDVSRMVPEGGTEHKVLEMMDVNSGLILPVFRADEPVGFMAFDNVSETEEWTEGDFLLLNTVSEMIGRILELRHVNDALLTEEKKYREFFRTSQDAVFINTKEGELEDFNESFVSMLGYESREELLKIPVIDLYANTEDRKVHVDTILRQGFTKEYPVDLRRKDGTVISTLVSSIVRKDENGDYLGFQGTIRDITDKKIAEEELRKKEERYRSTLDNMMEGCQIIGFDWRYKYLNDAVIVQAKQSREDLLGRTVTEAYPGFYDTPTFTHLRECMENRTRKSVDNEFTFPDGSVGWFRLSIEPVPEGIFILSEDVTDSKRIEEQLKTIVENLPDGIVNIIDKDLRYAFNAGSDLGKSGYTDEMLRGKTLSEVLDPSNAEKAESSVRHVFESGETVSFEDNYGPHTYLIRMAPLRSPSGKIENVLELMVNVSARKKAEEGLNREKELFQNTFESLEDAAFVLDADQTVIRAVNGAAEKVFGYSREEMIGKSIGMLHVDDNSLEDFNRRIHQYSAEQRRIPRIEIRMKRKDGAVFPTEHSISALFDYDQTQRGRVFIIRDITDIKESRQRESDAMKKIEKNLNQLATLNDEIRNPLTVIIGVLDLDFDNSKEIILDQVEVIDKIIDSLDQGWIESVKTREFLRKHLEINGDGE